MNYLRGFAGLLLMFCLWNVSAKEIRLLTIGNSFADSAFAYLPAVVKSVPGCSIDMVRANIGGCSLERHWREFEKSEKDSSYKPYYGKFNLRTILTSKKWDVVTIQQASHESWRPESYQPYADQLIRLIRELAPQAEIVIQQTWAYRNDDGRISVPDKGWKFDQAGMYERLTANYQTLAKKHQFRVIPVGSAVQISRARTPEKDRFKNYDAAQFQALRWPDLPSQAGDVVGNLWWSKNSKTGEMFIVRDPIHMNARGRYLQACVWFALLFDKKTSEISFVPHEIGNKDAEFLRACAQEAVNSFPQADGKTK